MRSVYPPRFAAAAAGVVALAAVASAVPASAGQSLCGPYALIAEQLRARFDERPLYRWPNPGGGHVVEFWRSDTRRTISIVAIDVRGVACVIATGISSEAVGAPDDDGDGA